MRFVLAFGALIALFTSADAATVHRSRPPHVFVSPDRPAPSATPGFAVPGWTDEQTRHWLDSTRPWHQA
jgi:hypothetical protein